MYMKRYLILIKPLSYILVKILFCAIILFFMMSCSNNDEPKAGNRIFTYAIDYTTNKFLGGYKVVLPQHIDSLEIVCDYKAPGDFGSVALFEKTTGTELFAGTIIWMGKGKRTFPEQIKPPSLYTKLKIPSPMPDFRTPNHNKDQAYDTGIDYKDIWNAIKYLQEVNWLTSSSQAYIYLYQPSVGVGDPADWYWLIFLKY